MFRVDDASRLIQFNSLVDRAADYGCDDRGQLLTTDYADVSLTDETFSYDANGNRTLTGYVTDEHNRYSTDGTYDYEYDLEGNRTRRTEIAAGDYVEYAWDHENRLVQVTERDASDTALQIVDYVYDLQGRRIQKTVTDPATSQVLKDERYVYDGEHIALQFDEDGDLTNRYLHGPAIDQILADEQISTPGAAGDVLWPLTDHLGTVRNLAERDDSTGVTSIANHLVYNSFGEIVSETNAAVDHIFGYTGRETDEETDLYFYRARYYDPAIGQFISEDPIGFDAGDANTRRYVDNSPLDHTDPSGLYKNHRIMEADATTRGRVNESVLHRAKDFAAAHFNGIWEGVKDTPGAVVHAGKGIWHLSLPGQLVDIAHGQHEVQIRIAEARQDGVIAAIGHKVSDTMEGVGEFAKITSVGDIVIRGTSGFTVLTTSDVDSYVGALQKVSRQSANLSKAAGVELAAVGLGQAAAPAAQLAKTAANSRMGRAAIQRVNPFNYTFDKATLTTGPQIPRYTGGPRHHILDHPLSRQSLDNWMRIDTGQTRVPTAGIAPRVDLPKLDGDALGFWQKQLRNNKITEAELRKLVHSDSVDEILRRLGKRRSGIHDKNKIIDSISKSSGNAGRAARDFAEGRITREAYERILDQLDSISQAQRDYWKRVFDDGLQ